MDSLFGYIYYRVCKAFFKWDGVDGHRAILAVAMIQTLVICESILAILSFWGGRAMLFSYSKILGFSAVGVTIILVLVNGRKYDGRYNEFATRWKDESKKKRSLNGFLVIISMLLPWIVLFLIAQFK